MRESVSGSIESYGYHGVSDFLFACTGTPGLTPSEASTLAEYFDAWTEKVCQAIERLIETYPQVETPLEKAFLSLLACYHCQAYPHEMMVELSKIGRPGTKHVGQGRHDEVVVLWLREDLWLTVTNRCTSFSIHGINGEQLASGAVAYITGLMNLSNILGIVPDNLPVIARLLSMNEGLVTVDLDHDNMAHTCVALLFKGNPELQMARIGIEQMPLNVQAYVDRNGPPWGLPLMLKHLEYNQMYSDRSDKGLYQLAIPFINLLDLPKKEHVDVTEATHGTF